MVLGTVQVKQELGSEYPALDKEIQDALWHYFFDVGKSVTYIKSRSQSWTLRDVYADGHCRSKKTSREEGEDKACVKV